MSIHEALQQVRRDVGIIAKGDKNDFHGFMFRGIERVLNKVGPALLANGINVIPELRDLQSRDVTTSKGKREREVTVIVAYVYETADGESRTAVVPGEASDAGDSATSKAMSVALRIAHLQMLQIPTGEADPAGRATTRGIDPIVKLKADIWAEAQKREWITDDSYQLLSEDFATWNTGEGVIEDADEVVLKKYLAYLKPSQRMQRPKPGTP